MMGATLNSHIHDPSPGLSPAIRAAKDITFDSVRQKTYPLSPNLTSMQTAQRLQRDMEMDSQYDELPRGRDRFCSLEI